MAELAPVYRPAAISVRATYAATDGSLPEEITVELDGNAVSVALTRAVIRQLAAVPTTRYAPDRVAD